MVVACPSRRGAAGGRSVYDGGPPTTKEGRHPADVSPCGIARQRSRPSAIRHPGSRHSVYKRMTFAKKVRAAGFPPWPIRDHRGTLDFLGLSSIRSAERRAESPAKRGSYQSFWSSPATHGRSVRWCPGVIQRKSILRFHDQLCRASEGGHTNTKTVTCDCARVLLRVPTMARVRQATPTEGRIAGAKQEGDPRVKNTGGKVTRARRTWTFDEALPLRRLLRRGGDPRMPEDPGRPAGIGRRQTGSGCAEEGVGGTDRPSSQAGGEESMKT